MLYINECINYDTPVRLVCEKEKKPLFGKAEPKIYFKNFNHAEFIGEELCGIRNIRCAHYFIAGLTKFKINKTLKRGEIDKYSPSIGIGSYDFTEKDKNYKRIDDYEVRANNGFESMLKHTKNEENKKQLCRDMLEMIALDIYMGQVDRSTINFMFEEDGQGNIRLAPLYDFEYSLSKNLLRMGNSDLYTSDLYSFDTIEDCQEFIGKYPMFRDILSSYLNVNLVEVISRSYSRRGLTIPSNRWNFYMDFDKSQKEKIQKILTRA